MSLIIFALVLVLAVFGCIDSFIRCIAFALDKTRGLFARVLVGLLGVGIVALVYSVIKPFFNGSLEGLGVVAYFVGVVGPVAVVFAIAGGWSLYSREQTFLDWLGDQFSSRSDR